MVFLFSVPNIKKKWPYVTREPKEDFCRRVMPPPLRDEDQAHTDRVLDGGSARLTPKVHPKSNTASDFSTRLCVS